MDDEQQHVLGSGAFKETNAQQRAVLQIEGAFRLRGETFVQLGFAPSPSVFGLKVYGDVFPHSLARLTAHLMQTYGIPAANVVGHRDTKATQCPGRYVNLAAVRQMATQALATSGGAPSSPGPDHAQAQTASTELLTELAR